MKSPFRRVLAFSVTALLSVAAFQGCNKEEGDSADPLTPPTLEFLGASNSTGEEFEPGEDLEIACDGYLTLHLGPKGSAAGTILDWTLRPPGVCGSLEQCGYVSIELLEGDGTPVASFDQAVASPFLNLSDASLSQVETLRATLILGNSRVPFEHEGVPVSAVWDGSISRNCEASGSGGADGIDPGSGGGSGTGGSDGGGGTGGTPSIGGAGGFGGSTAGGE